MQSPTLFGKKIAPVMTETEITIAANGVTLAGTLCVPEKPGAVVIFVHGSGPQDRDQNSTTARLNIFNVLSRALAQIGVASFRYDKRGVGASTGELLRARQSDLTDDLIAVIADIARRRLGPVTLCGHSEGTAIAPAAATQAPVAGLILLCPYVTPGADILKWQAAQGQDIVDQMRGLKGAIARAMARILGGPAKVQDRIIARVLANDRSIIRVAGRKVSADWLRDFITTDIAALHRTNTLPTLVVVAERDCQCPPGDGAVIAGNNGNATLVSLADLSHLLRQTTVDGFLDYPRQLTQPMDDRVVTAVCDWMTGQPGQVSR